MELDVPRMYRFAMKLTIVLTIGSALFVLTDLIFGVFSQRAVMVQLVGIGFWLLMFAGYRADLKERLAKEEAAKKRANADTF